ncbi:rod shape-determining protein MreC [Acetobacter tropicalis]|uniref:Cell shape-determining protein MreC n=1 Tax=Acetobacter tropicalis TaxID=104102 RepID=A0A095B0X2_9PROT|nr:rod shape-determining protein MreC [Acetobacter tropicalis]KAA8390765.1 rod shape-determining protein MreC [Acetobacter tropicalis]KAA8393170.1 rod shape-determining protein MreC [Acetobacter tropicalis]KGB22648.1 Rod shape-determining protein MreC [Acetobacter tropicalis]MBC9007348.1 rod shape-determining protein MreC [Acetobacter tropicalis]MDO8171536.1 rod shape-determining protein MreC [Acetobacter tropicalis]
MIPVSIQVRQALGKLVLPLLLLLSIGVIIGAQADKPLADRARMYVADALAPLWSLMSGTQEYVLTMTENLREAGRLARENARLKTENENLRRWYDVAVSLTRENDSLKTALHWIPEPAPAFVTGRVVADSGGIYARAVLLVAGTESGVQVGNVALAANGLAGRVTETGAHSARILLITDIASRLPVMLEASHAPAIMVGDNSPMPRLMYYAQDTRPIEGERVVTSDQAGAFPAGLPIGTVHYVSPGRPVVAPFAQLDHLTLLRVFNFGRAQIEPPEAPGHVPLTPQKKSLELPLKSLLGQG